MAAEYKLSYTASEVNEKLGQVEENSSNINNLQVQVENILNNTFTDSKFFNINYEGIISLNSNYLDQLPEKIVFPEVVGDTAVTGFQSGMFQDNKIIKEIVFPDTIIEIPENFCFGAINLHSIQNTKNIEILGNMAFQRTKIEKALFPNLKQLGINTFNQCLYLQIVDIGNSVTEIPSSCFQTNVNLSLVKGGENVTKIGEKAFMNTANLKNLPFLENVTTFSNYALFNSRIQFDWSSLSGATFGTYAYPTQDNTTNYWAGCTFEPCENQIVTALNQRNPIWVNENWGTTSNPYSNGCGPMAMMHVHSALSGIKYNSPKEFEADIAKLDNGADLLALAPNLGTNFPTILTALGHTVEHISDTLTTTDMQNIYNSLADGAYIIAAMSATNKIDGKHLVALYGVNDIGEVLFLDSDNGAHLLEVYDDLKLLTSHMPLQNFTGPSSDFWIVKKTT